MSKTGYKSPPQHSRWRPGASGNPAGRPKRVPTFADDLMAELKQTVQITEGGRVRRISKQRLFIKSLTSNSVKGDARAARLLISMCARVIEEDHDKQPNSELDPKDLKILEDYIERQVRLRLAQRERDEP
jgi:hypothetical protein